MALILPVSILASQAIGSVGSTSQIYAGHELSIVEPGTVTGDVLALYKFGATITADSTANAYTLTNVNTVAATTGILNVAATAALFNGTSQYFWNATLLDTTPTATAIAFWFKSTDGQPAATATLCYKKNSASNDILNLNITTTGIIQLITNGQSATAKTIASQTILPNNQTGWYHLTISWDATNGIRMWVNGILEASDSTATTKMATGTTTDFYIGSTNAPGNYFGGVIDEFKVLNRIITQRDVDQLYSSLLTLPAAYTDNISTLEAVYQPAGISDFQKVLDITNLIVSQDSSGNIYRQGFTPGWGLQSTDNISYRAKF